MTMNASTTHGSPETSVRQAPTWDGTTLTLHAIKVSKGGADALWFGTKHGTIGAFVLSRWLLTQRMGLRVLSVLLALAILWVVSHPQTDRIIVHDVITGAQTQAHAGARPLVRVITTIKVIVAPSSSLLASDRVPRPAVSQNLDGYLLHAPSISSGTIQRALEAMGSPMATAIWYGPGGEEKRMSNYIFDAGKVTGVDPAVMLAISYNESHAGRDGMAASTHSLGNQRPSHSLTPVITGSDGSYAYFDNWGQGVDAQVALLRRYATGQGFGHAMPRWSDAVSVYAPVGDFNSPSGYLAVVLGKIHDWEAR